MIFSSEAFLIFFPIVLFLLHTLPQPWRNRFQLVASCYFYGSWDWRFLGLIFLTSAIDYNVALQVEGTQDPVKRRRWLLVCLCSLSSLAPWLPAVRPVPSKVVVRRAPPR